MDVSLWPWKPLEARGPLEMVQLKRDAGSQVAAVVGDDETVGLHRAKDVLEVGGVPREIFRALQPQTCPHRQGAWIPSRREQLEENPLVAIGER